jgi:hypothetical protein
MVVYTSLPSRSSRSERRLGHLTKHGIAFGRASSDGRAIIDVLKVVG